MRVHRTAIDDVFLHVPDDRPHVRDTWRRLPVRETRSRCAIGATLGLHGRPAPGDPSLVGCTRGTIYDVVVDARPASRTFGCVATFLLDDVEARRLEIPAGCLNGYQALTAAEVVHVVPAPDAEPAGAEPGGADGPATLPAALPAALTPAPPVTIRLDDPDLAIRWPMPLRAGGGRDRSAVRWVELCGRLGVEVPERSCAVGW